MERLDSHDSILVVIVNFRTAHLVIDCIESLKTELDSLPNLSVVITDNHSGDDSVARIQTYIESERLCRVICVPLERNGGFAYGNNAAIRPALAAGNRPDYVLLLNPDTVVRPGAIGALVRFMDQHPQIGIAGSRLEDPDGTPQRSAFRFPTAVGEFERSIRWGLVSSLFERFITSSPVSPVAVQTDWVAGASMMVRREVFDAIGLLDEGFFMYFEEVDFCLRAARAGWPCWYVPESRVVHLVGQSSGVTDTRRPRQRRPAYWFESRRRYLLRNKGRAYTLACDILFMVGMILWKIRRVIQRKAEVDPPRILSDFFRHSVLVKGFSL
jgi:GT2 family glycosyltransferase